VIENELRDLLTERAGSVAENPARVREVHARIGGIRRRRAAGAALALVLVALAGLALTRLPGKPETLPAGVPSGPYFDEDGGPLTVPGYRGSAYFMFSGDDSWSALVPFPWLPHVIVARCQHRGDLGLGDPGVAERRLSCRVPVGDHFEGALLSPAGGNAGPSEVSLRPGSSDHTGQRPGQPADRFRVTERRPDDRDPAELPRHQQDDGRDGGVCP
jgi:hypothetical protein